MGWASGSQLMEGVIKAVQETGLDCNDRQSLYEALIVAFEDRDCDTLEECEGLDFAFDAALRQLHPDYYDE